MYAEVITTRACMRYEMDVARNLFTLGLYVLDSKIDTVWNRRKLDSL